MKKKNRDIFKYLDTCLDDYNANDDKCFEWNDIFFFWLGLSRDNGTIQNTADMTLELECE